MIDLDPVRVIIALAVAIALLLGGWLIYQHHIDAVNNQVAVQTQKQQTKSDAVAKKVDQTYVAQHQATTQTLSAAHASLQAAATPQPSDDPQGKAVDARVDNDWRASIARLCPDCAA